MIRPFISFARAFTLVAFAFLAAAAYAQEDDAIVTLSADVVWGSAPTTVSLSCNTISNPSSASASSGLVVLHTRMVPSTTYTALISSIKSGSSPGPSKINFQVIAPPGFAVQIDYFTSPGSGTTVSGNVWRTSSQFTLNPTSTAAQVITIPMRIVRLNGQVGLRAGMAAPFSTDQSLWQLSLGSLTNGNSAGQISFANRSSNQPLSSTIAYQTLSCDAVSTQVKIVYQLGGNGLPITNAYGNRVIRQVIAPQVAVDVSPTSANTFEINCYHPVFRNTTVRADGTYSFSADPFARYIFTAGATDAEGVLVQLECRDVTDASRLNNAVKRTLNSAISRAGAFPNFNWTAAGWYVDGTSPLYKQTRNRTGVGEVVSVIDYSHSPAATSFTKTRTFVSSSDPLLVSQVGSEIVGQTNSITTDYDYFATVGSLNYGLLKTITSGDSGVSQDFSYTADNARLESQTGPFKNANGQVVTTRTYSKDALGNMTRPASTVSKINGIKTFDSSTSYDDSFSASGYTAALHPYSSHPHIAVVTATTSTSTSASASLITTSKFFSEYVNMSFSLWETDDFFVGLPYSSTPADGTKVTYFYQRGVWNGASFSPLGGGGINPGPATRSGIIRGASSGTGTPYASYGDLPVDSIYLIPGKSTLSTIIRDEYARVVREEGYIFVGGVWNLISWTNFSYNLSNQLISRTTNLGTTYSASYSGERLISETDESGITTNYDYDTADRIISVKRNGIETTFEYDGLSHKIKETVTGGAESLVAVRQYDDAGRLASETLPGLGTTTHSYDPVNLSHTTSLASGAQQVETSYSDGKMRSVTGSAVISRFLDYGVEADGRQFSVTNIGSSASPRWSKSWIDWIGREIEGKSPDPSVLDQTTTNGAGIAIGTTKAYDSYGRISSVGSTGKATTYYQYDELSNVSRVGVDVDNSGGISLASMDRITDSNTLIEKLNNDWWRTTTTSIYASANNSTALTSSITRSRLTGFSNGSIEELQQVDIDGNTTVHVTTLDRSTATKTITTSAPGYLNSAVQTFKNGLAQSAKDFDGLTTSSTYDALNRLSSQIDKRGNAITYFYKSGTTLVSSTTDAASNVTSFGYDAMGRRTYISNPLSQTIYTDYNDRGQVLHEWGYGTYPVAYTYDPVFGAKTGMSTFRSQDPAAWSNSTWPTSPPSAGDTTHWSYDVATGMLKAKTDSIGKSVTYTYKQTGQTDTTTSARGITTHYAYDSATSELSSVTYDTYVDPDSSRGTVSTPSVSYTYSRLGQIATITDATGQRTLNYDSGAPWRLAAINLPAYFNGRVVTPIYETATSGTGGTVLGREIGFDLTGTSPDIHHQVTISNLGRVGNVNTKTTSNPVVNYTFNYKADGMLDGYSSGNFSVSYAYEGNRDLVVQVKSTWSGSPVTAFDYVYNTVGLRRFAQQSGSAFADYGSAVYRAYTYNNRGELESTAMYDGTAPAASESPNAAMQIPGRRFEFRYDDIGNRTSSGQTGAAGSGDDGYRSNGLNQYTDKDNNTVRVLGTSSGSAKISGISSDGQIVSFNLKGRGFGGDLVPRVTSGPTAGNITVYGAVATGGGTAVSSVSKPWLFPGLFQSFKYDSDGNLIDDGINRYYYDAENRLVKLSTTSQAASAGYANQTLEFTYDFEGRRVQKRVTSNSNGYITNTRFLYDGWNLIAEIDGGSLAVFRSYTWGAGSLLQLHDIVEGKVLLPTLDANNNVTSLINAGSGAIEAAYEYGPSGELLRAEGSYALINHFRYSSHYQDDESGLAYYGHRYYSPNLGRFINRDPIGEDGGINLYAYCANDGINQVDALGHFGDYMSVNGYFSWRMNAGALYPPDLQSNPHNLAGIDSPNDWINDPMLGHSENSVTILNESMGGTGKLTYSGWDSSYFGFITGRAEDTPEFQRNSQYDLSPFFTRVSGQKGADNRGYGNFPAWTNVAGMGGGWVPLGIYTQQVASGVAHAHNVSTAYGALAPVGFVNELVGINSMMESGFGVNLDGELLTGGQRFVSGAFGSLQLAGTVSIVGAVRGLATGSGGTVALRSQRIGAWRSGFGQPSDGLGRIVGTLPKGNMYRNQLAQMLREIRASGGSVAKRTNLGNIAGEHITQRGLFTSVFRYNPRTLRIADFIEEQAHWMQIRGGMLGTYSIETLEILAKQRVLQTPGLSQQLRLEFNWDIRQVNAGNYVQP